MNKNKKLMILLFLAVIVMGVFAYANKELYQLFCQAIGISLSPNNKDIVVEKNKIDENRKIKVVFTTETMNDVPVDFRVEKKSYNILLGAFYENNYTFINLVEDTLYFRPIHSVYPPSASNKYSMVKCFCFDDMILMPREKLTLPMSFRYSTDLDSEVNRIVMHYSLVKREKEDVLIEEEL